MVLQPESFNYQSTRFRIAQLPQVGIDLEAVTKQLEEEGIQKFIKPFNSLLQVLEEKRREAATV